MKNDKEFENLKAENNLLDQDFMARWEAFKTQNEEPAEPQDTEEETGPFSADEDREPEAAAEKEAAASDADKKRKLPPVSLKNVLIVILPALAVIIAAVIVLTTTKKASGYLLKEDGYQTYAGAVKKIAGGTELIRNEDGTASIVHDKEHETISNLPIYYMNSKGLIIPEDWLYYNARRGTKKRADYFSEISFGDVNEVHAKRGSKDVITSSGFIFDGSNSYIFTEPVRISYNGYEIDLAPFSFAEVVYGEQIVIYEYESGKEYMDIPQTDVIAEQVSGDYAVSLTYDMLQYPDGTAMLLFTRPDLVDSIYDDK